jgi:hypothetical protein
MILDLELLIVCSLLKFTCCLLTDIMGVLFVNDELTAVVSLAFPGKIDLLESLNGMFPYDD